MSVEVTADSDWDSPLVVARILVDPQMITIQKASPTGFFVAEAKSSDPMDNYIPQAVAEMYGCAKLLECVSRSPVCTSH